MTNNEPIKDKLVSLKNSIDRDRFLLQLVMEGTSDIADLRQSIALVEQKNKHLSLVLISLLSTIMMVGLGTVVYMTLLP